MPPPPSARGGLSHDRAAEVAEAPPGAMKNSPAAIGTADNLARR